MLLARELQQSRQRKTNATLSVSELETLCAPEAEAETLRAQWGESVGNVPLIVIESPYRLLLERKNFGKVVLQVSA